MIPNSDQFKVSSLDAKRAEKQAAKSPFGPIKAGVVKPGAPKAETK
jgi:hypothetical protein